MFAQLIESISADFDTRQTALIEALGDSMPNKLRTIKNMPGLSYGEPPFVIEEGDHNLLWVDADGHCTRLSRFWEIPEDAVNPQFDALYTTTVNGGASILRFIPVLAEFHPGEAATATLGLDENLTRMADLHFGEFMRHAENAARQLTARSLIQYHPTILAWCDEEEMTLAEFVNTKSFMSLMFTIFAAQLSQASRSVEKALDNMLESSNKE